MLSGGCLLFHRFAVSRLAISVFWHFGISVSYAAGGIQKCEHDHDNEHIRQSSALFR